MIKEFNEYRLWCNFTSALPLCAPPSLRAKPLETLRQRPINSADGAIIQQARAFYGSVLNDVESSSSVFVCEGIETPALKVFEQILGALNNQKLDPYYQGVVLFGMRIYVEDVSFVAESLHKADNEQRIISVTIPHFNQDGYLKIADMTKYTNRILDFFGLESKVVTFDKPMSGFRKNVLVTKVSNVTIATLYGRYAFGTQLAVRNCETA